MGFGDAVLSALFVMVIVLCVLLVLWIFIRLFSLAITSFEKATAKKTSETPDNGTKAS